jgi:hypothetical protein
MTKRPRSEDLGIKMERRMRQAGVLAVLRMLQSWHSNLIDRFTGKSILRYDKALRNKAIKYLPNTFLRD